jgi:predicted phosphodiesterase
MEWIKEDLKKVDPSTPIAISTHIPFISVMAQMKGGSMQPNTEGLVVHNSKEVLELFKDHNLKLVLQGHLHYLEDIYAEGVHFITGGAVSGKWWTGPRYGVEEGFLKIRIKNGDINWEYIDYGWEATE